MREKVHKGKRHTTARSGGRTPGEDKITRAPTENAGANLNKLKRIVHFYYFAAYTRKWTGPADQIQNRGQEIPTEDAAHGRQGMQEDR